MTVLQKGFRVFFLAACLVGGPGMALWAASLRGWIVLGGPLGGVAWHAHEMVMGFTMAVLAGFFLTAVQNWTGRVTAVGPSLAGLVALWLAGRVAAVAPLGSVGVVLDVAFPVVLALVIARPLIQTSKRRNYAFIPLFFSIALADALGHLSVLDQTQGARLELDAVLVILVIIGGRIVPMFTRNAVAGSAARRVASVDRVALGLTWMLLAADWLSLRWDLGLVVPAVASMAGLAHLVRLGTWDTWGARRSPILWVLHLGYLWLAASLMARGAPVLGLWLAPGVATHLFTAGAVGTMTLGMMSRVTLGHTGRALVASPWVTAAYAVLTAAVVVRVVAALGWPQLLGPAAALFAVAFLVFGGAAAPVLLSARVDGRPG